MKCSPLEVANTNFNLIDLFENTRAVVIGDVMLDEYLIGNVERISPEAPVPILHIENERYNAGGAANVASNLVGLGLQCTLVGLIGNDAEGEKLKKILSSSGIYSSLQEISSEQTIVKTRVSTKNQQMLRIDRESRFELSDNELTELFDQIDSVINQNPRVIVLSDYAKGMLTFDVCQHVIKKANILGIPVIVDPKGRDYSKYRGATAVTPNLKEALEACGIPNSDSGRVDIEHLISTCEILYSKLELDFFVLTRSEEGITLIEPGSTVTHFPTQAKEVFDVSGAGDTVIATIAASIACKIAISDAMMLANTAASVVVGRVGTSPILLDELLDALHMEKVIEQASKICNLDVLLQRVEKWRKKNARIVFTNGCFDILHAGHVNYLELARKRGDKLIVALNSDRSVRKLKGVNRPVITEKDRARVLAALESIDAIILFDDDTPISLIHAIRPEVLAKGNDYNESQVVGASEVQNWGGEVALIPISEGRSTSRIISKLSRQ